MNRACYLVLLLAPVSLKCLADGIIIDKIYDPYVQQLEHEVEFRALLQNDDKAALDDRQRYKLGYGQALSDDWFAELYVIGGDSRDDSLDVDAVELEVKYQLTEQGEYANDYGLLFELERDADGNAWELSSSLIVLHEWQRWVGTVNASVVYEWGTGLDNELETSLVGQLKYRYQQTLEPALELHLSQDTKAIGPALLGEIKLDGRNKLLWEAALLGGLNDTTPELSINLILELEFY